MSDDQTPAGRELEELFDKAPSGYITALPNGTITKVNQTFASWMGREISSFGSGTPFRELLTVPSRIYFDTHLSPLLQMQGYFRGVALDFLRADLAPLPAVIACTQESKPDGTPVLWRMSIADATDRRRYEQELLKAKRTAEDAVEGEIAARQEAERASRAKDEVLALVSHELKTPLSAILGWTHLLRKNSSAKLELDQGLDVIERNTRILGRLVEDLLDMSRIVSGKLRLDVQHVNLSESIQAALDAIQPAVDARCIRLQRVLDPGVLVSGDPTRLQQIFWNLLTNATKFTGKGGWIKVVMERVNSHIEVSVVDSGQGISADLLPHIFERFRQADSVSTRKSPGLGLGLSLVKYLVEMHGGSIVARSGGEGRGAEFVVSLPVIVMNETSADLRHHPQAALTDIRDFASGISLAGVRVLIVDDDADAREVLMHMLAASGAEPTAASSSGDALSRLEALQPDVLISDIGMPGEDGYELIRRVRMRGDGNRQLPAIALTALSRMQDRTQALLAGFQIHLAKPVDAHELTITIASLVNRLRKP